MQHHIQVVYRTRQLDRGNILFKTSLANRHLDIERKWLLFIPSPEATLMFAGLPSKLVLSALQSNAIPGTSRSFKPPHITYASVPRTHEQQSSAQRLDARYIDEDRPTWW